MVGHTEAVIAHRSIRRQVRRSNRADSAAVAARLEEVAGHPVRAEAVGRAAVLIAPVVGATAEAANRTDLFFPQARTSRICCVRAFFLTCRVEV